MLKPISSFSETRFPCALCSSEMKNTFSLLWPLQLRSIALLSLPMMIDPSFDHDTSWSITFELEAAVCRISNDLTDPFTNANSYVMICVFGEDDCIAGHCLDHFSLLCAVYWSPLAAARIICTRLCGKGITCMLSFPDIGSKAVQVRANKYSETDELSNCFLAGRFPFCATKLLRAKSLKFCWKKNACADHWWLIIWALHFWGLRRRLIWMLNLW